MHKLRAVHFKVRVSLYNIIGVSNDGQLFKNAYKRTRKDFESAQVEEAKAIGDVV